MFFFFSEQPCENLSQDIPVLNADSDLKLKQKRVCDEKSEMSENDPFAFQVGGTKSFELMSLKFVAYKK